MTVVYDGTLPAAHERTIGPGNPTSVAHIANPDRPGWSMCLIRLTGLRRDGAECEDCLAFAQQNRNTWISR